MWLGPTIIASAVALPAFTPGTPFYFGFGGSGGLQYNRHEVRNITLTVPTVRCM
jgi:hypothetical protein